MAERGLWIGTYPDGGPAGSGEGIWHVRLDERTGALSAARPVVETPAPSFLARHPDGHTLYAVAEVVDGRVTAFAIGDGVLVARGPARSSGGALPCHLAATAEAVVVANYGGGTVASLRLDAAGALTADPQVHRHTGSGPDPQRQDGPHPHFVAAVGAEVWVPDLGTDRLHRYRRTGTGLEPAGLAAVLPPGSGPRHLAPLPGGPALSGGPALAVATELDAGVHVVVGGRSVARRDAAATPPPPGARSYPSHIELVGGTRLYVAVRGADVLAAFAVEPGPGGPRPVHRHDTPVGAWPRHFAVVPGGDPGTDLVVVANQESSELVVLRFGPGGGPGERVAAVPLPRPACVLPA